MTRHDARFWVGVVMAVAFVPERCMGVRLPTPAHQAREGGAGGKMMDYWMSTKSPREIFRPAGLTVEIEAKLRELDGICSAIIAADLGLPEGLVQAYQRRLGLRAISMTCSSGRRYPVSMRGHNSKIKTPEGLLRRRIN